MDTRQFFLHDQDKNGITAYVDEAGAWRLWDSREPIHPSTAKRYKVPIDPALQQKARATWFYLEAGTVQPIVTRQTPWLFKAFGRAEYDRDKPVLSDSIKRQAQPIIDQLNAGTLTVEEGVKQLDKIWF